MRWGARAECDLDVHFVNFLAVCGQVGVRWDRAKATPSSLRSGGSTRLDPSYPRSRDKVPLGLWHPRVDLTQYQAFSGPDIRMATPSSTTSTPHYRRVILKLSGESFARSGERGISMEEVVRFASEISRASRRGAQIAIVIGGGNILRGAQFKTTSAKIQEATAHYMGMLATTINGLALQDALESLGCETRLMVAIRMDGVAEPYIRRRARRHLEKGRICIMAAGTGSPFVTTDTAAAQRALELEADIVLKATRVDGVYSEDPEINPHAVMYRHLDYNTVRERDLRVMDHTAVTQCMEHNMPILVFNYQKEGNIERAVGGERLGTLICSDHRESEAER